MDSQESFYVEGGVYEESSGRERFHLVRAADGAPYVTRNPNGLKSESERFNVYKLSDDGRSVFLVKPSYVKGYNAPPVFFLDEDQSRQILQVIRSGRFMEDQTHASGARNPAS